MRLATRQRLEYLEKQLDRWRDEARDLLWRVTGLERALAVLAKKTIIASSHSVNKTDDEVLKELEWSSSHGA